MMTYVKLNTTVDHETTWRQNTHCIKTVTIGVNLTAHINQKAGLARTCLCQRHLTHFFSFPDSTLNIIDIQLAQN